MEKELTWLLCFDLKDLRPVVQFDLTTTGLGLDKDHWQ
jgi:hypothetical protein